MVILYSVSNFGLEALSVHNQCINVVNSAYIMPNSEVIEHTIFISGLTN